MINLNIEIYAARNATRDVTRIDTRDAIMDATRIAIDDAVNVATRDATDIYIDSAAIRNAIENTISEVIDGFG